MSKCVGLGTFLFSVCKMRPVHFGSHLSGFQEHQNYRVFRFMNYPQKVHDYTTLYSRTGNCKCRRRLVDSRSSLERLIDYSSSSRPVHICLCFSNTLGGRKLVRKDVTTESQLSQSGKPRAPRIYPFAISSADSFSVLHARSQLRDRSYNIVTTCIPNRS